MPFLCVAVDAAFTEAIYHHVLRLVPLFPTLPRRVVSITSEREQVLSRSERRRCLIDARNATNSGSGEVFHLTAATTQHQSIPAKPHCGSNLLPLQRFSARDGGRASRTCWGCIRCGNEFRTRQSPFRCCNGGRGRSDQGHIVGSCSAMGHICTSVREPVLHG